MNSKIDKLAREIEKTRAKITEGQERLRELERQKTELENTEIVTLFRAADIAPGEIAAILRAYKETGAVPVSAAPPATEYPRANAYAAQTEEDNSAE